MALYVYKSSYIYIYILNIVIEFQRGSGDAWLEGLNLSTTGKVFP